MAHLFLLLTLLNPTPADARKAKNYALEELRQAAEITVMPVPKDNEACFSPEEMCVGKLVKFIATAKNTLDIAIFELTDRRIAEAIVKASEVAKVRMVVNRKLVKDSGPAFDLIKKAGVQIRAGKQKGIMHNKFTIVDGKRLETGSFNYSYTANGSNHENQLYLSTPSVVERYQNEFDMMWKEGKH